MSKQLGEFLPAALAGCCACIFTNPLELVKTRMQLQGELKPRGTYSIIYRNVFHASYTIAKHEGLLALQKGLCPALLYQVIMNGTRLSSYQILTNLGLTYGSDGKPVFVKCLMAGAFSGGLSAFLASPTMLLKTQFQAQASENIAVGFQHHHKGFIPAVRGIYIEYGITGLWRGCQAGISRNTAGTAAQLSTFDSAKHYIKKINIFDHHRHFLITASASLVSSFAVVVAITPFDFVSTRLFNQKTDQLGRGLLYNGIFDCFRKVFCKEGILGFYKGVGAQYFRTGPQTVLCLIFWDKLRQLYRDFTNKLEEPRDILQ